MNLPVISLKTMFQAMGLWKSIKGESISGIGLMTDDKVVGHFNI
jgi:hypothetical protein